MVEQKQKGVAAVEGMMSVLLLQAIPATYVLLARRLGTGHQPAQWFWVSSRRSCVIIPPITRLEKVGVAHNGITVSVCPSVPQSLRMYWFCPEHIL